MWLHVCWRRSIGAVLVLALAVLAGTGITTVGPDPAIAASPFGAIRIGLVVPLTTANAFIGKSMKLGADLAVMQLNDQGGVAGRRVELVSQDNADKNETAVNALNKALDAGIAGVILGSTSAQTLAMSPIIKAKTLPTIVLGSSPNLTDHGNEWIFTTRVTDAVAAQVAVRFAVERMRLSKVAVFHAAEEFGTAVAPEIISTLAKYNLRPVVVVSAPSSDRDFSGQILQIKNSGAEALLTWVLPAPGILLLRQLRQAGVDIPVISNPIFALTSVLSLLDPALTENLYTLSDSVPSASSDPRVKTWASAYQKQYNEVPDFFSAMAFDSVMLLARAAEGGTQPGAMKKALESVKAYRGMGNLYTTDDKHRMAHEIVILNLAGKRMTIIDVLRQ